MNRSRRGLNIGIRQSNSSSNSIIEGHRGTSHYRVKPIYSAGSMVEYEFELTAPGAPAVQNAWNAEESTTITMGRGTPEPAVT
jgi:hypothetical protein